MTKRLKLRVAEVTIDGSIQEYDIVASGNVEARDLLVKYLAGQSWKNIRVRDTSEVAEGSPRVLGKRSG